MISNIQFSFENSPLANHQNSHACIHDILIGSGTIAQSNFLAHIWIIYAQNLFVLGNLFCCIKRISGICNALIGSPMVAICCNLIVMGVKSVRYGIKKITAKKLVSIIK